MGQVLITHCWGAYPPTYFYFRLNPSRQPGVRWELLAITVTIEMTVFLTSRGQLTNEFFLNQNKALCRCLLSTVADNRSKPLGLHRSVNMLRCYVGYAQRTTFYIYKEGRITRFLFIGTIKSSGCGIGDSEVKLRKWISQHWKSGLHGLHLGNKTDDRCSPRRDAARRPPRCTWSASPRNTRHTQTVRMVASSFSREKAIHGGPLILIKNDIQYKERLDVVSLSVEQTIEVACIELEQLVVLSVYRPPKSSYDAFDKIMDDILYKISKKL
ncbi:hypothetical protein EVAR_68586_1 [Eumeta japonica]|uniref:Uncharacterized protein n=1 Tax=Eumeta variegata TaxID=151549 RepID=A0A4C2A8J8_EUMVA|nr:hypothetical protein EVAR_68586_1 [Eumeta japonica]